MKLANIKVGRRLIGAFLLTAAISAVIGAIGIRGMHMIDAEAEYLYQHELLGLSHVNEATIDLMHVDSALRSSILADTTERRAEAIKDADKYLARTRAAGAGQTAVRRPAGARGYGEGREDARRVRRLGRALQDRDEQLVAAVAVFKRAGGDGARLGEGRLRRAARPRRAPGTSGRRSDTPR